MRTRLPFRSLDEGIGLLPKQVGCGAIGRAVPAYDRTIADAFPRACL